VDLVTDVEYSVNKKLEMFTATKIVSKRLECFQTPSITTIQENFKKTPYPTRFAQDIL
jgi:hypothetical protein